MSLLENIKNDQVEARKNLYKDNGETKESKQIKSSLLTTLYSEAAVIGKNNGNRETTDSEVQQVIKKFIKNIDEFLVHRPKATELLLQKQVLQSYLPKQLTEEELQQAVDEIVGNIEQTGPKAIGAVMKQLKMKYDGQFDGKTASTIVKNTLENKQ